MFNRALKTIANTRVVERAHSINSVINSGGGCAVSWRVIAGRGWVGGIDGEISISDELTKSKSRKN